MVSDDRRSLGTTVGQDLAVRVAREERALVERYHRRAERSSDLRYASLNLASLLAVQDRDRTLVQRWLRAGLTTLNATKILDVGCGNGVELLRLVSLGAAPSNLHGIDLLPERVAAARALHPDMNIREGSATKLPWPPGTFDMVMQYTMFSSILDPEVRRLVAGEMARVLRPGGMVIWYDFVSNPTNRDVRGLRRATVRSLFSEFNIWLCPVTLAPPLARRLASSHPRLTQALHAFVPLRTHLLGVLTKPVPPDIGSEVHEDMPG